MSAENLTKIMTALDPEVINALQSIHDADVGRSGGVFNTTAPSLGAIRMDELLATMHKLQEERKASEDRVRSWLMGYMRTTKTSLTQMAKHLLMEEWVLFEVLYQERNFPDYFLPQCRVYFESLTSKGTCNGPPSV